MQLSNYILTPVILSLSQRTQTPLQLVMAQRTT